MKYSSDNPKQSHQSSCLVRGIWYINLLLLLVLIVILSSLIFFPGIISATAFSFSPILHTTLPDEPNLVLPPTAQQQSTNQEGFLTPNVTDNPEITPTITAETPHPIATLTAIPTATHALMTNQKPLTIGYSTKGRPLDVYQFGSGPVQRLIIAGIHGGYEWNTVILADELIEYLSKNNHLVPEQVTLFILRNLNPDGLERGYGVEGRANANNVDLNRNWDAFWSSDWPQNGCWNSLTLTAGPYPMSEVETIALEGFIATHPINALINYHSAGLGIFPGGQPADPQSLALAQEIASVSPYAYPPLDTGCKYTGQLIDWASQHGIVALDIELSNHKDSEFKTNLKILTAFLNWEISE